jgi:hypothetical protein
MNTSRMSSNQYTIMKALASPLSLEKAIGFNQLIFMSLVKRGWIELNLNNETFHRSEDGSTAFSRYTNGSLSELQVAHDPPARHERVTYRLSGQEERKPTKRKPPVKAAKHAAA